MAAPGNPGTEDAGRNSVRTRRNGGGPRPAIGVSVGGGMGGVKRRWRRRISREGLRYRNIVGRGGGRMNIVGR